MGSIWHIGIAVPDLDLGKKQLADVFGPRWRPVRGDPGPDRGMARPAPAGIATR